MTAAEVNRSVWQQPAIAAEFQFEGWTDPGEIAALVHAARLARGVPTLDIGQGAGRTTSLLALLTDDYQAVDFTPAMVELARRRHPHADIRVGDARRLLDLPDDAIGLAVFSFNGIDAVDHDDRAAVLAAVRRVLQPGGVFVYSTLNRNGPLYGLTPWRARPLPWHVGSLTAARRSAPARTAVALVRLARDPGRPLRSYRNWRRLRRAAVDHGDWAIGPLDAHDFGLLVHFTELSAEQRSLAQAGFSVEAVYAAEDGRELSADSDTRDVRWFHLVCRLTG